MNESVTPAVLAHLATKPDETRVVLPTKSRLTLAELIVIIVIVVVLVALLLPAIYAAREAARRTASSNNLKQIALSFHNYESAFQRLPSGSDARCKHGWTTYVSPFLEASAWYNKVDYDVSWEHALNRHHFGAVTSTFRIPNGGPYFTLEGFGITNYLGNPSLLHRASFVKFSDVSAGLQHVWLAGEVTSNVPPYGYPTNWRTLTGPIQRGSTNFGAWHDGGLFAFLDGSVQCLQHSTSQSVIDQLAQAHPLPAADLYSQPNRTFTLGPKTGRTECRYGADDPHTKGGPPYSAVCFDRAGNPEFIDFFFGEIQKEDLIKTYPQARVLRCFFPRHDDDLKLICHLSHLETLSLMGRSDLGSTPDRLSLDQVIKGLKGLPQLKFLKLKVSDEDLDKVQAALPQCEVIADSGRWR